MMNYMLTFKKAYPVADVQYYATQTDAVKRAIEQYKTLGFIPDAIYQYNSEADKYDKIVGKFGIK